MGTFRRDYITRPIFAWARKATPAMSDTEREALEAGDVWWDGDLFTGNPDWAKLLATPPATLTAEEQAFLEGPVNEHRAGSCAIFRRRSGISSRSTASSA
jgi:acyl-CoA dehydrogenase